MRSEQIGSQIRAAETELDTEYRRTQDEMRALKDFQTRIADLDVEHLSSDGGASLTVPAQPAAPDTNVAPCKRVFRAYRDTILALPHYTAEYDEPLRTNMEAEFGPEIVSALNNRSQLTEPLKQALQHASHRARQQRKTLLRQLDIESDSLTTVRKELTTALDPLQSYTPPFAMELSFDELQSLYEMLDTSRTQCGHIADTRQEVIQTHSWTGQQTTETVSFHAYLYTGLDVTYPALADIATGCRALRRMRRQIVHALSRVD